MINLKEEYFSVVAAFKRFWKAIMTNRQPLMLMLLAVVSLFAVVVMYATDYRLSRGSWKTYENGEFSIIEPKGEQFEKFEIPAEFKRTLEKRNGGKLICAYQKSVLSEINEVKEIFHINVFDISGLSSIYKSSDMVHERYLKKTQSRYAYYDVKRLPDIHSHPAMAYKSKTRDEGGFYSMGIIVCAHQKAYYFENYSHYSPYSDWENDEKTYFYPSEKGYPENFTVDDMERIENRFFMVSMLLFALFTLCGVLLFRIFIHRLHPGSIAESPILNPMSQRRFNFMVAVAVFLGIIMIATMVSFWQYKGTKLLTSAFYVLTGIFQLSFSLPMLVHLYKKARTVPQAKG